MKRFFELKESVKYNPQKRFDYFNKLIFNNEIIRDFPVSTFKPSSVFSLGRCIIEEPNTVICIELNINNKFPELAYDVILIHEMIHAHLWQVYGKESSENSGHGKLFMKERESIVRKFPEYPIPIREDLSAIESILDELGL